MPDLRLLLIDATPIDGPAATSALKRVYLSDWAAPSLLHLLSTGDGLAPAAAVRGELPRALAAPEAVSGSAFDAAIEGFAPEAILYRPVADCPALHGRAMRAVQNSSVPLALWLMDDWPMRLKDQDPARHEAMDRDLRRLFARSSLNWAISEPMAEAYAVRYGVSFEVMRNAVAPAQWPRHSRRDSGSVLIRYAGSLAPDTARAAVFAAARGAAHLAEAGLPVEMEIRTQQTWLDAYADDYAAFPNVRVSRADMTDDAYRRWLAEADILLMAYNFDPGTKRYLQYSFANKTPETLASGAAVLAYGPRDLATIDYLAQAGDVAAVVAEDDPALLTQTMRALVEDADRRRRLAEAARAHAFSAFDMAAARGRFREGLARLAAAAPPSRAPRLAAGEAMDAITVKKTAYRRLVDGLKSRFPAVMGGLRRILRPVRGRR